MPGGQFPSRAALFTPGQNTMRTGFTGTRKRSTTLDSKGRSDDRLSAGAAWPDRHQDSTNRKRRPARSAVSAPTAP
jgi:hypothetical protein